MGLQTDMLAGWKEGFFRTERTLACAEADEKDPSCDEKLKIDEMVEPKTSQHT